MNRLSNIIKRLMADRKMTVIMLSEKSGLSQSYLYDILADKVTTGRISLRKLELIAKALNSSLSEITEEPGFVALKGIREQMSMTDLALVDAVLSLKPENWKRQVILHLLGIDTGSQEDESGTEADDN